MSPFKEYYPTNCDTAEDFMHLVDIETPVIEIGESIRDSFLNAAKKDRKEDKRWANITTALSIPETAIVGVIMACTVPEALLAGGAIVALFRKALLSSAFSHYELAVFEDADAIKMLVVNQAKLKKGNYSIKGLEDYHFIFSGDDNCPACEKKQKNIKEIREKGYNPYSCVHCGQKYIWTVNLQKYLKESMRSDAKKEKEYKQHGIPSNYSASNNGQISKCVETLNVSFREDNTICQAFRKSLMTNKFSDEHYFAEEDGAIYSLENRFLSVKYGTPDAEVTIIDLQRFINIRARQIGGNTLDHQEKKDMKHVSQSYHLGMPVKIGNTYENVLKEIAWFIVMAYLCNTFLKPQIIIMLLPKNEELFSKWNSYVNNIRYAPQSIRDLFKIDDNGSCKYIECLSQQEQAE